MEYKKEINNSIPVGVSAGLMVKRGDKSNNFFIVIYNILLAIGIAVVSIVPEKYIEWHYKIIIILSFLVILFFCFRLVRARNLFAWLLNKITNFEEKH